MLCFPQKQGWIEQRNHCRYLGQILKAVEGHQVSIGSVIQEILEDVQEGGMPVVGHAGTSVQGRPTLLVVLLIDMRPPLLHQKLDALQLGSMAN